jgi:hypothetical protein
MIRTLSITLCIMVMFVSCKTNIIDEQKIELKNQLIGITSAHNARQLCGYQIGDQRIKNNLLLRTAKISELSEEDSLNSTSTKSLQKNLRRSLLTGVTQQNHSPRQWSQYSRN